MVFKGLVSADGAHTNISGFPHLSSKLYINTRLVITILSLPYVVGKSSTIGNVTLSFFFVLGRVFEVKQSRTFTVISHSFFNQLQSNFAHYFS